MTRPVLRGWAAKTESGCARGGADVRLRPDCKLQNETCKSQIGPEWSADLRSVPAAGRFTRWKALVFIGKPGNRSQRERRNAENNGCWPLAAFTATVSERVDCPDQRPNIVHACGEDRERPQQADHRIPVRRRTNPTREPRSLKRTCLTRLDRRSSRSNIHPLRNGTASLNQSPRGKTLGLFRSSRGDVAL
jgi:hypothetical protein